MCTASRVVGDTWISVRMYPANWPAYPEDAIPPDGLAVALEEASARAGMWPAPYAVTPTPEWWSIDDACIRIADEIDIAAALGSSDYIEGYPTDAYSAGPIADLVLERGTEKLCPWFSYETNRGIYVELFPGAAGSWTNDISRLNGTAVDVDGAAAAAEVDDFMGVGALLATDGTNVVVVSYGFPGDPDPYFVAAAVLRALL